MRYTFAILALALASFVLFAPGCGPGIPNGACECCPDTPDNQGCRLVNSPADCGPDEHITAGSCNGGPMGPGGAPTM